MWEFIYFATGFYLSLLFSGLKLVIKNDNLCSGGISFSLLRIHFILSFFKQILQFSWFCVGFACVFTLSGPYQLTMDGNRIEKLLLQLENGEISEDESDIDEDSLDYYEGAGSLRAELEKEIQEEEQELRRQSGEERTNADDEIYPDPPLLLDNLPENQPNSVNYPVARNLVWKKKNMALVDQALEFQGVSVYPQHILDLSTPFQFFSYFFEQSLLELIVAESSKSRVVQEVRTKRT